MRRHSVPSTLALGVAGLATQASPAHSAPSVEDSPPHQFRVAYDVPDGCPSKSDFIRYITDRIGNDWQAKAEQEKAGTIAAEVARVSDGFEIHLICVSQTGTIARREFRQSDCKQAVEDTSVMAVACIQLTIEPPPMTWFAGVTAGLDWKTGASAASGGVLFGIRWPVSPFSLSFNPMYAESLRINNPSDNPWQVRLLGMRVEGCVLEPRWGVRLSFPICAAVAGGYLQTISGQSSTSRDGAVWATFGLSPHAHTFFGSFFVQLGPTLDVYLARRELPMGGSAIGYGRPPPVKVPVLSGGVLLSVGYGAGHF